MWWWCGGGGVWGDLILIEAILTEKCISIRFHCILIENVNLHFGSVPVYWNRSAKKLSLRLQYSGKEPKKHNSENIQFISTEMCHFDYNIVYTNRTDETKNIFRLKLLRFKS